MTESTHTTDRGGLHRVVVAVLVVGALAAGFAAVLSGLGAALSVGLGAAIGAANLWVVGWLVRGFLASRAAGAYAALALVKLVLLLLVVALLVHTGVAEVLALVIGLGALPLGILAAQLFLLYRGAEDG